MTRNLDRRLTAITAEVSALRAEVAVLAEQVSFQRSVAEETEVRALVAETPLADREARVAAEDLRRIERVAAEAQNRLATLLEEQDRLLGELVGGPGPG
jgi:hypothetical protein